MITRNEKSATIYNAKKAEVSDFEKTEVKKILDEIVGDTMGEKKITKKASAVEKKPVKKEENLVAGEKKTSGAKKPAVVKKTVAVKKPSVSGQRMGLVKKGNVDELNRKLAEKKAEEKAKKPAGKITRTGHVDMKPVKKAASTKVKAVKKIAKVKPPLVSVILSVHNGERYIDSAIHSVLGQTFADFELIIVDDFSEDGTLRVVKEFSSDKIKVISLDHKSGMAKARNQGLEVARGQYICFLNAHDMWQPDKLERQLEFVQEKHAAFSYTGYVYSDENGMPFGKVVRVPAEISRLSMPKISSIFVSTVMFDLNKLSKNDIMMPDVKDAKAATWEKVLEKTGSAHGLNEVLAIHGYDGNASLWKKVWRRV